jgi:putative transposase
VQRDRTVSLHGVIYEVDATLVGESVTLRYDPDRPRAVVQVFSGGVRAADARPLDANANCFVRRARPVTPEAAPPPTALRLSELTRKKEDR